MKIVPRKSAAAQGKRAAKAGQRELALGAEYQLPPLDILSLPSRVNPQPKIDEEALEQNARLLETLNRLRDLGNSVIVVEHDEEAILAANHVVDMGPGAGIHGGEVVAEGTPDEIMAAPQSLTGQYLTGFKQIPMPKERRKPMRRPCPSTTQVPAHRFPSVMPNMPSSTV